MRNGIIGVLMVLLVFSVSLITTTYAEGKPRWKSKNNIIETDDMVVMFKDRMPIYHVWIPRENGTAVYIVKFNGIIEYVDNNGNGVYDVGIDTKMADVPFTAQVEWNIKAEYINQSGITELRITMNGTVPVLSRIGGMIGSANVVIVNHIFSEDTNVNDTSIEGGKELKIDVILGEWPWSSNESMLALEVVYAGMFRGKNRVPEAQNRFQEHNRHAVRLRFSDANFGVEFRYSNKAYMLKNGTKEEVYLNSTNNLARQAAVTWISFPHYTGKFVYDPSIAVVEGSAGGLGFLNQLVLGVPIYLLVGVMVLVLVLVIVFKRIKS